MKFARGWIVGQRFSQMLNVARHLAGEIYRGTKLTRGRYRRKGTGTVTPSRTAVAGEPGGFAIHGGRGV